MMSKTLLQSKASHANGKPMVLLKQSGKKYFVYILNHQGDQYEAFRSGGCYDPITKYKSYDDAHNKFLQKSMLYDAGGFK
tara:strand:+ start:1203 stop:1442 length:240 start_codon:yes stop_codon:yes gene_type:complete